MQSPPVFEYRGKLHSEFIRHGNAAHFIKPFAEYFCRGVGLDIGGGQWTLPGAINVDKSNGGDALALPARQFDYIFSSHCLEHVVNPVAALEHWKTRLVDGGVLFLYLPHPYMTYWKPQWNRKHLHSWRPEEMAELVKDLGFVNVIHSERDLYDSFAVVGFNRVPVTEI